MPFPRGTILKQLPHLSLPRDLVHVGTDVHLTDDKFGMTLPWPCLEGGKGAACGMGLRGELCHCVT